VKFRHAPFPDRLGHLLGSSRHSALPELRRRVGPTSRSLAVRAVALACGSTLIGLAVALLVQADLGLPPYDVLSSGVASKLGVTLGQAGWILAGLLLLLAAGLGRRPSGWGIAYIVANGLAVDGMAHLVNQPESVPGRVLFLVGAVVVMAAGVNLVLYSGTTGGPFELLMLAGEDRGVSRVGTRYALDGGVLAIGLLIGGTFGIGTMIYTVLMGITLQVISQAFADHGAGRRHRLQPGPLSPIDGDGPAANGADRVPDGGQLVASVAGRGDGGLGPSSPGF
jgi:uncharacterized membrane protein YczE